MDSAHLDANRPRTPLSSRLRSLLSPPDSHDVSPRSSSDSESGVSRASIASRDDNMQRAQSLLRTSHSSSKILGNIPFNHNENINDDARTAGNLRPNRQRILPNRTLSVELSQQPVHELPVLRWFGKAQRLSRPPSSVTDSSRSSLESPPSTPPSALREALEDDFPDFRSPSIARPEAVKLTSTLMGRMAVHRSPPFLESLARSTLPTASITRPPLVFRQPSEQIVSNSDVDAYIDITQSPPLRTSLDSLRSLRDTGTSPTSPERMPPAHSRSFSTNSTPNRWWWGKERKASVDRLLDESDQADTIEREEDIIRKKCRFSPIADAIVYH